MNSGIAANSRLSPTVSLGQRWRVVSAIMLAGVLLVVGLPLLAQPATAAQWTAEHAGNVTLSADGNQDDGVDVSANTPSPPPVPVRVRTSENNRTNWAPIVRNIGVVTTGLFVAIYFPLQHKKEKAKLGLEDKDADKSETDDKNADK